MCCARKNDCLLLQHNFSRIASLEITSKTVNTNCQEMQKSLTGKRLDRRLRREPLCSSSPPEETPHRTEIGTESGASCNWPAAAVEGSTSCFCPALPHCCSLKESKQISGHNEEKVQKDVQLWWCEGKRIVSWLMQRFERTAVLWWCNYITSL